MSSAADQTLPLVRASVRDLLLRSEAFRALPAAHARQLANDMVKVARYIVDAGGQTAGTPMSAVVSTGLADRAEETRQAGRDETAGRRFRDQGGASAAQSGASAFTEMINRVDFPHFVGGLVEGVFNAIVTSSIRQMEAYSTLVANIAKSVDEYMRDNISTNQARDYLAGRYPEHLQVDTKAGEPKLIPRPGPASPRGRQRPVAQGMATGDGGGRSQLPDFMKDLGLPEPVTTLNARTAEQVLVPAARRRMAMDRQQLLATMVLMGINRLIVTDGRISASCLFELDTSDAIYQDTTVASSFDETVHQRQSGWRFWFIPAEVTRTTSHFNVTTTNNSSSEAEVKMHAELSGKVDINFRSETFPLEKMADLLQIQQIEEKAPQAAATPTASRPAMTLPPPPPLPTLPGAPGSAQPVPTPGAGAG